jgi:hypothetical protein
MPIYQNQTDTTIVENFRDANGQKRTYKILPGKKEETEFILTNANLTKVNDFPQYNPIYTSADVTSTGVGDDKTVAVNLNAKQLSILNQSDVEVLAYLNVDTNRPGIPCAPNTERLISLNHNVEQVVFKFAGAATIKFEQRDN